MSNGSGSNITGSVNNISMTCSTNTYSIGGNISGLSNTGLVLRNNGTDDLSVVSGSTTFLFAAPVAYNGSYNVTVQQQPATQTCTVSNGTGSGVNANVSDIDIDCVTNSHTVGGMVSGLFGNLTLQNNGADNLLINTNGAYTFPTPIAQGSAYNVTVFTQPADEPAL